MKRLSALVFISGRGSNLKSLLQAQKNYEIVAVLSNKPNAPGLRFAQELGVYTFSAPQKGYPSVKAQKEALYQEARRIAPDVILLAGYMQIVEPHFLKEFAGRIMNIHPSLLPVFPGLDTHRRALAAKVPRHGCTVHLVTEGVDEGPIIAQAECAVLPEDTEETLEARVLELECRLYPWVINLLGSDDLTLISEDEITASDKARAAAKLEGFLLSSA